MTGALGDELLWGGVTYKDLVAVVNMVRNPFRDHSSSSSGANEALPVLQSDMNGHGQKVNYSTMPEAQD